MATQKIPIHPSIVQRVSDIEHRNIEIDEKAQDDRTITIKEVYERVVKLEVLVEIQTTTNKKTAHQFTWFALFICIFEIINIFLNILIIRGGYP